MLIEAALAAVLTVIPAADLTDNQWERRVIYQINQVRDAGDVRQGRCVDKYAERWARRLENKDQFRHRRDLTKILIDCKSVRVGEVLARGQRNPKRVVRAWMNSPPHRKIILRGVYDRVGVGVHRDESGQRYIVANLIAK